MGDEHPASARDGSSLCLLTVHGHPDDEVFHAGGTLARYAAEGVRVVTVTGTRGEVGEIVLPELDTPENRARLGELRLDELGRALAQLGVAEHRWLGYRDSGMAGTPDNDDPRAFWQADAEEAAGRLVGIIREVRPQVVLTHDEGGGDGHPDHVRAAQVARLAFDRAGEPDAYPDQLAPGALEPWTPAKLYEAVDQLDRGAKLRRLIHDQGVVRSLPVVARAVGRWRPKHERERARATTCEIAHTTRIDVRPWLEARHRALLEFRTQLSPHDETITVSAEDRARFMPTEDFCRLASRVPAPAEEDDLFAGLREPLLVAPRA